jgi:hypothetical protein
MNRYPTRSPGNNPFEPAFFQKTIVIISLLLLLLAVFTAPCGATDGADESVDAVFINQTTVPTTVSTTNTTTAAPTITPVNTTVPTTTPTTQPATTSTTVTTGPVTTGTTVVITSPTATVTAAVITTNPTTKPATTVPTDEVTTVPTTTAITAGPDAAAIVYTVDPSEMGIWTYDAVDSIYPWSPGTELPGQVSGTITSHPFSLEVGSDNQSRISYIDTNQHLVYAERDTYNFWKTSTVDDSIPAGENSLALLSDNSPGISYYDTKNRCLEYAHIVQGTWHTESVECSLAGPYNSLVYTKDKLPMIGYYSDGAEGKYQILKFTQRDQNRWWIWTPKGGAVGMFGSLALNATGSPVIGHYDGGSKRLKYAYRADAGDWRKDPWKTDLVVDSGGVGRYLSMVIDSKNRLHFSYYNETGKSLKYAEGKIGGTGNDFTRYTIDTGNVGTYTSLALDTEGNPHITYWDEQNQRLKYAVRYTNGTWAVSEIRPWITGSTLDKISSLVIGPDNIPRLCCIEHRPDGTTSLIYSELKPALPPKPPSNLVVFGDTLLFVNLPLATDYQTLGGNSAIHRNGVVEHFYGPLATLNSEFKKYFFVQVTNGAGITTTGDLGTWDPWRSPTVIQTVIEFQNATPDKKYLMVSQYFDHTLPADNDWRLVLYVDGSGATRLEVQGNKNARTAHPEVFDNVPTDTGWIRVAAGRDHALAIRSNGTLFAWGKNDAGQLNLPANARYSDIAAGEQFSIGLTVEGNEGAGGYIYTAGADESGQVSGAPKDRDTYIMIAAGPNTAGALTHDGHILTWGRVLTGIPTPTDGDYTDLIIGDSFGIALKEPTKELHITGPISPGQVIPNTDGVDDVLPDNLVIWHTHNDVSRVYDTVGTQQFWANDEDANWTNFPNGAHIPLNLIHYVKKGSDVNGTVDYRAVVTGPGSNGNPVLDIHEDAWYDEGAGSLPRAMCVAGIGCSAGVSAKQQLFLSEPVQPADGAVPVFSAKQLSDTSYIGTLSILGSSNAADTTSIRIEKKALEPTHTINFSIISGNWGNDTGTNMWVTAQANLTPVDSGLNYTITATASQNIPLMELTPQIWEKNATGEMLVFTDHSVYCSNATICIATGNYTPSADADYFANASVLYVVPTFDTGNGSGVV